MMKVIIAGHLGADVETRYTDKGKKVSTIRVAANTRRAGRDETVWWRVTLWGDDFDNILPYLKKGSGVIVMGDFVRNEIYMDREGKPQMSLEVSARTIEFNPFGRSDKAGEGQTPGYAPGNTPPGNPITAQPTARSSSFATNAPGSPPSYAASHHHPSEAPHGHSHGQEAYTPPPSYTASYTPAQATPPEYQAKEEYTPRTEDVPF